MRRKDSSLAQFRARIPLDVRDQVRGSVLNIPVGAGTTVIHVSPKADAIKVSLQTRDPEETKARHASVQVYLGNVYAALRAKVPVRLTREQCVALAADFYRGWTAAPLADQIAALAPDGEDWSELTVDAGETQPSSVEQRVLKGAERDWQGLIANGTAASAVAPAVRRELLKRGLKVDVPSFNIITAEFVRSLSDALEQQARMAKGDFRADPNAQRFPSWESVKPTASSNVITFADLITKWQAKRTPAPATVKRMQVVVTHFEAFIGHNEPHRVAKSDFRGWRDALAKDRTPKTVNEVYLAFIKLLYGVALAEEMLEHDPTARVRDERKEKAGKSRLPYDDEDVAKILALADNETDPRFRWIPWLVALTGARVGEIAQLWSKHVMERDGIHFIRITETDDGGSVKTGGSERDVPLHPAIIERGFLEFVASRRGPLFYGNKSGNPQRKPGAVVHASGGVANRVREWVRESGFTDARKAPNHSFRHWFKSVAPKFGIASEVADQIQGHVGPGIAAHYRHARLEVLHEAICKVQVPTVK